MNGTWTRVFAAYPLAIPFALGIMAAIFPGYVAFDDAAQRVTISFTVAEIVGGTAAGYALIVGVFAKWGIKR